MKKIFVICVVLICVVSMYLIGTFNLIKPKGHTNSKADSSLQLSIENALQYEFPEQVPSMVADCLKSLLEQIASTQDYQHKWLGFNNVSYNSVTCLTCIRTGSGSGNVWNKIILTEENGALDNINVKDVLDYFVGIYRMGFFKNIDVFEINTNLPSVLVEAEKSEDVYTELSQTQSDEVVKILYDWATPIYEQSLKNGENITKPAIILTDDEHFVLFDFAMTSEYLTTGRCYVFEKQDDEYALVALISLI